MDLGMRISGFTVILEATGQGFYRLTVSHVFVPSHRPVTRKSGKVVPRSLPNLQASSSVGTICASVVRRCEVCENPKVGQKGFYNLGWEQARAFTGLLLHPGF